MAANASLPRVPRSYGRTALVAGGCAIAGALVLGVAIGLGRPLLAVIAIPAIVAVPFLVLRQRLALAALTCAEALNLGDVAAAAGLPKIQFALLGLAVAAVALPWVTRGERPRSAAIVWFALAYVATRAASLPYATDPAAAGAWVAGTLKDTLFLAVVVALCVSARGARLVAVCLTAATAALALLTVAQQFLLGNATELGGLAVLPPATDIGLAVPRHSGPYADPNFWGRQLVVTAPLALALFAGERRARRWWWLGAFAAICGGVYLTGSRGTQLALAAAVIVWCLVSGRRYARLLWVAPLLAGLLFAVPGVGSRLVSLADTSTSGAQQIDPSLQGRIAAQEMALLMARDHPALGVGAGNFTIVEPAYQRRYGYDTPVLAPHNLYLEQLAEGGIVGLAGWLALFGAAVFAALRARLLLRRPGRAPPAWYLTGGVLAALAGWAVASAFLHLATFRIFLLVAAVGVGLDVRARAGVARRAGPAEVTAAIAPRPPRRPRTRLAAAAAAGTAVAAAVVAYVLPGVLTTAAWQASAQAEVVPRPGTRASAYGLDVLSRQPLTNTYLALLAAPRFQRAAERGAGMSAADRARTSVTSVPRGMSAILAVRVETPDAHRARAVAAGTRDEAAAFLARTGSLYVLRPRGGAAGARPVTHVNVAGVAVTGSLATLLAAAAYAAVRHGPRKSLARMRFRAKSRPDGNA